jgi:hypothetical protein
MDHAPAENWYGLVMFDRETNIAVDFTTKQRGDPYGVGELTRGHVERFRTVFHDAMVGVMQDLATQYKIVVKRAIPADGRLHKVRVEAFTITNDKRNDFKVRVREGVRRPLD